MTTNLEENGDPRLQGVWLANEAVMGGAAMPQGVLEGMRMVIDGDRYEVSVAGSADAGSLTIDSAPDPKRMIIAGEQGPNAGRMFKAIYRFEGENLQIAYDLAGSTYPAGFGSEAGTQQFVVLYRPEK